MTKLTTTYKSISKMSEIIGELEIQAARLQEQRAALIKRMDTVSQSGTFKEQLKNIQKTSRDLTDVCKKIESLDKKYQTAFETSVEAKKEVGYRKAHSVWYKANTELIKLSKSKLTSKEDMKQAQEKRDQALANLQEVETKASNIFLAKQAKSSKFITLTPCDVELYEQELKRINGITKKKYRW